MPARKAACPGCRKVVSVTKDGMLRHHNDAAEKVRSRLAGRCRYAGTPAPIPGALWLCETFGAGPLAPRHLRPLSAEGTKPGGGADTLSLCGRTVAWDVAPAFPEDLAPDAHARRVGTCAACLTAHHTSPQQETP